MGMLIKNVRNCFPAWMIRFVADFDFLVRVFQMKLLLPLKWTISIASKPDAINLDEFELV